MKRMMSWILWTPAPIQMLLVVAGMDVFTDSDEFILVINLVFWWKILISKHKFTIYFRVVGLKGVQPRAADTTATVRTFFPFLFRSSILCSYLLVSLFLNSAFHISIFFMPFQLKECIQPGIHRFFNISSKWFYGLLLLSKCQGHVNYYKVCESIVRMKVDG